LAQPAQQIAAGELEGIVLKQCAAPYRDGKRGTWSKVKDPSWHEREAWRFEPHRTKER
jgi:ATP-dependent DNA ligase